MFCVPGQFSNGHEILSQTSQERTSGRRCGRTGPTTAEGRARLSEAKKLHWDNVKAAGQTRLGPLSDEGRASLAAARTGRKASKETRKKISEARLRNERAKSLARHLGVDPCSVYLPLPAPNSERLSPRALSAAGNNEGHSR